MSLYIHMNRKVHVACNFNSLIETEGRLKVKARNVQWKSGSILETVKEKRCYCSLQTANMKSPVSRVA